jgi:hypothetical protein
MAPRPRSCTSHISLHHTAHCNCTPGIFNRLCRTVPCGPWLDVTEHSVEYIRSASVYTFQVTSLATDTLRRNVASPRSTCSPVRRDCSFMHLCARAKHEPHPTHTRCGQVVTTRRVSSLEHSDRDGTSVHVLSSVLMCMQYNTKTFHRTVASSSPTSRR